MRVLWVLSAFIFGFFESVNAQTSDSLEVKLSLRDQYVVKGKRSSRAQCPQNYAFRDTAGNVCDVKSYVDVTIINHAKSPRYFVLMSCSHWDNFIVNTNEYYIDMWDCDKNIPQVIKLSSDSSVQRTEVIGQQSLIDLETLSYTKVLKTKLRLGLILLDNPAKIPSFDYERLMDDRSTWKIIWSNPLEIYRRSPY